jgi:hypothetical protein
LPFRRKAGRQVSRRMLPSTPPQNDSRIRKPLSKSPDSALVVICTIWFFGGAHHGASVRNTTRVHFDNGQVEWSARLAREAPQILMGVQFPIATTLFGRGSEFWELLRKMNDPRQYAPATLRNRDFIVGVLRDVLPTKGVILEIASGSGEHVVHFARNFPSLVFQPSDREPDALQSIAAWTKATGVTNVRAPMVLDVSQSPWPIASADGIICINMVHISPWETTLGLIRGAAAILPPTAPLYLYGPYKREGFATASSNQAFDRKPSRSQPDLGSARPRSGRSGSAIRRILGSDDHRDARKQSECGVPSNLTETEP